MDKLKFLSIYDNNDLSCEMWLQLSIRLQEESKRNGNENKKRYKKVNSNEENKELNEKGMKFIPKNDNSFSGILNHLRTKSNGKIENEVSINASSIYDNSNNHQPFNVVSYENTFGEIVFKRPAK